MKIRAFHPADKEAVVAIWTECGLTRPWNDPQRDIARKLTEQPELFLVAEENGAPVGTAMVGYDGHRGWVHYLAVKPGRQREALGRALMAEAERLLLERGCPKVMLMVRTSNAGVIRFYEKLGYAQDDVVVMGRRLIADT
jgi:ribosomal protein S18 acetylase RimI-like enzyme